jgi:zinc protease
MQKTKLNRKIPPPIHPVTSLDLPTPSVTQLDNGIPVYAIRLGTQEIMKMEVVILRGRPYEHKRTVSRATSRLLREGTPKYSSAAIAEEMDFYAGTFSTPVHMDTANLILFCLTKQFKNLLPLVAEMLLQPTFPQHELNTFIENNVHRLAVDLSKNDVVAYRKITELMYGEDMPYGYSSTADDYRNLTPDDLRRHHTENYTAENIQIFLSGNFDDSILTLLNQYLGKIPKATTLITPKTVAIRQKPQQIRLKNPESMQSSIRLGCPMGNRKQVDYAAFFVLNTILGGYFGSRLMSNIREEKGYTYNIYSSQDLMFEDGYFYIASDVGNKFVDKTLTEIYREMEKLQNDLVGEEELSMVRNYLLGNLLTMVDGPFAVGEVVRTFVTEGMPFSEWESFVNTIRNIQPTEIRDLAQRYLKKEAMFEVVVGA